jgi:hypothetical protein
VKKEIIFDLVSDKIAKAHNPIIVCGHFQLVENCGSELVPGIYQDLEDAGMILNLTMSNSYAGDVPYETFNLGASLVKEHLNAKILILVKDWRGKNGHWVDSSGSQLSEFYVKNELATSFEKILSKQGLSHQAILKPPADLTHENNSFYFSENALIKSFTEKVEFQSCSALGHICAQEQIPKYSYLSQIGCDLLVNFFPQGCGEALFEAKVFSQERYPKLNIFNIFLDGAVSKKVFWDYAHY